MSETQTKKCIKCKEDKELGEFCKSTRNKDGLQRWCNTCWKDYREENKEYRSRWNKEYRTRNREYLINKQRQHRIDNPEHVRLLDKQSKERNKEKVRARKQQYYQKNKTKINTKNREKYRTNILFKLRSNISAALKNAFTTNHIYKYKRTTFGLLGYSVQELQHSLQKYLDKPCERCGQIIILHKNAHIDHIIPIALAYDEDSIIELYQLSNLRLICKKCNQSKNSSLCFDRATVDVDLYNKFVKPVLEKQNE